MTDAKENRKLRGRVIGVALLAYVLQSCFSWGDVFPWGIPQVADLKDHRVDYQPVDTKEDSLRFHHGRTERIFPRGEYSHLFQGPETVVIRPRMVGDSSNIYLLVDQGFLLSMGDIETRTEDIDKKNHWDRTGNIQRVRDLGNGRPLGSAFTKDGKTLYIADAVLGLTRIEDLDKEESKVEIVASSVVKEDGTWSKLSLVDDVCVGPQTGKVYFTDASEIPDIMYASKVDLLRGRKTGRVLEYNPTTDQVRVLVDEIFFANGLSVDKDERYLVVAESFAPRILKFYLAGPKSGEVEVLVDRSEMMGYPDGVDCDHKTGKCYAVLPSAIVPIHKLLNAMPLWLDWMLRILLLTFPRQLTPPVKTFGGILEMDPETRKFQYLLDPYGQDIAMLTGVTVHDDKLYLGSLHNPYIAVYSLEKSRNDNNDNNDNQSE